METNITESQTLESCIKTIISKYDDPNREGLVGTPKRYIKFLSEFLHDGKDFKFTMFNNEGIDEMIVLKNIEFYSLCEHHLVPFYGTGTIAYMPDKKIVGISKLARCLDYYARGFQNQERITTNIAERLELELKPLGVAVILEANHLCMSMRGIKKNSKTVTSKLTGRFRTDLNARNELLNLHK